jgi:hypothetical protein
MSRMGELSSGITMATGLGVGASNPMSGGSPDGYDRGGGTGRDKLLSGGMQSGKFAGVTSFNTSNVGKMPSLPAIKAGDIPAKAPKLPTNPSMGKGAGMRSGAFNLGSNGPGMRLD